MKIHEFVKKIAVRFDSKLQTDEQREAFFEDCKNHLKRFEGEILGFAFEEFVYKRKFGTHPKVAEIVKMCIDKQSTEHKAVNPVNEKQAEWQKNMILVKEFKLTDSFKWAAQRMIGHDVLLYIERNGGNPNKQEIDKMLKSHVEFKANMERMENEFEMSDLSLSIYKMGKSLNERNLEHFNQFNHRG